MTSSTGSPAPKGGTKAPSWQEKQYEGALASARKLKLPDLEGTQQQIKWAVRIRHERLQEFARFDGWICHKALVNIFQDETGELGWGAWKTDMMEFWLRMGRKLRERSAERWIDERGMLFKQWVLDDWESKEPHLVRDRLEKFEPAY